MHDKGLNKKPFREFFHRMGVVLVYKLCPLDQKHCLIILLFKGEHLSVFLRTMITTCAPSYPHWTVSGEWNQPCRDSILMSGSHYKFFLIGHVFEYLSSCPTHTPHLLFIRILFNLKFDVVRFHLAVYWEFMLNKHFPNM